jgi:hypothetical protein
VEVHFQPEDPDNQYYLMPCSGLTCVAPLWCVGTTEEQADANMAWTTVKVTLLLGHDFYGPLKPKTGEAKTHGMPKAKAQEKPKAKAKEKPKAKEVKAKKGQPKAEEETADAEADICDEGTQSMLAVPVLVNCKPLRKGDELRLYKPKIIQKKARDVQPINIATLAKRAKTKE